MARALIVADAATRDVERAQAAAARAEDITGREGNVDTAVKLAKQVTAYAAKQAEDAREEAGEMVNKAIVMAEKAGKEKQSEQAGPSWVSDMEFSVAQSAARARAMADLAEFVADACGASDEMGQHR